MLMDTTWTDGKSKNAWITKQTEIEVVLMQRGLGGQMMDTKQTDEKSAAWIKKQGKNLNYSNDAYE